MAFEDRGETSEKRVLAEFSSLKILMSVRICGSMLFNILQVVERDFFFLSSNFESDGNERGEK